jgi:CRISPR-associated protein Cmr6
MSRAAVPRYVGEHFKDAAPGHRFNLYFEIWKDDWSLDKQGKAKAIGRTLSMGPVAELSAGLRSRQRRLAESLPEAARFILSARSTSPFATGLGLEHPVENGFAFLSPYGLPYLAGSGVKGVLRRAAEELAEYGFSLSPEKGPDASDSEITQPVIDALFGPEDTDNARRGALIFWDVFPACKEMAVDIMTPHHGDYYQGKSTPHDAGQPTPIPFLAVPAGAEFTFIVACEPAFLPENLKNDWKPLLAQIFDHAFDWLGFGAKTAVGYGAMRPEERGTARNSAPARDSVWENATVAFNVSTREMTAQKEGKKAGKPEAKDLFNALGSKGRQDKARSAKLQARVKVRSKADGTWELLDVLPPEQAQG